VTLVMWNLVSVHLEIVFLSVQDRCTVCAKRTIGSEIVGTRLVHGVRRTYQRLEIVLDAPDGSPR
jgi:hypothetical protein